MFQTLKDAALNILGYLPIVKSFVPNKYKTQNQFSPKTRPELESFHRKPDFNKGFSNPMPQQEEKRISVQNTKDWNLSSYDQEQSFSIGNDHSARFEEWERVGKEALNTTTPQKFDSIRSLFELNKAINNHVRKRSSGNSAVDFQSDVIKIATMNSFNSLVESYKKAFPIIHDPSLDTEIDPNIYVKLMHDHISRSLNFIIELEGRLIDQIIRAAPNSSDLDIAKAIHLHKELSKSIAKTTLLTIMQSFELLPSVAIVTEQGQEKIASIIGKELRDSLRTLYLASKFGIHSKTIIETFKAQVQKINVRDDITIHKSLMILNELQNAIHGSLIQGPDTNIHSQEIAQLDPHVINNALENLIKTILKEFAVKQDDIDDKLQKEVLRSLNYCKHDLAMFLTKSAEIESETQKIINTNKSDKVWQSINLDSELENQDIEKAYSQINKQTNSILGYTNTEIIKKIQVPGTQISNYLKGENLDKHFTRIIYEVSLLAGIDVLASFRKAKAQPDQPLTYHPNFQTIPWLKDFYNEKYKQYSSWIESPQHTELETRRTSKELSKLGSALNQIGYFDFSDFASDDRYRIVDDAKNLLNRAANHTDIGVLALTLEIFSTLFSYLEFDEKGPFTQEEVKQIQNLVSFLKKETTLIGPDGKQVVAPKRPNTLGVEKANYMKSLVGSRGFLTLNTPIIIKFLERNLNNYDHEKTSIQRDSLLATLLFYVLVKYTPSVINDVDSLKAKAKIFKLALKLYSKGQEGLPVLYRKFCRQVLGLNDTLTANDPSIGQGLFKSMITDLENKILEYPKQKRAYEEAVSTGDFAKASTVRPSIELDDLLEIYVDIESALEQYPEATKKIEETLHNLKNIPAPLSKGIQEMIKSSITADIHTTVGFIKHLGNEDLIHYTEKLLLDTAAKHARSLLSKNLDDKGRLIIFDYDQAAIDDLKSLLEYIKHTGFLLNHYGVSRINIRGSTLAEGEDTTIREQIVDNISAIKNLLSKRIALIANAATLEEEVFPGQFEAKRTLLELVKEPEFKLKPVFGSIVTWIPSDKKLKEASEIPKIV